MTWFQSLTFPGGQFRSKYAYSRFYRNPLFKIRWRIDRMGLGVFVSVGRGI
jgi:hypothetical protein